MPFRSRLLALALLPAALAFCASAHAQRGLFGDWREQGGGLVRVAPCGGGICLSLLALPPRPPSTVDHHNPDPALRTRPLCGLRIGYDFQPQGPAAAPSRAVEGRLYDPRSGKTYRGEMTLEGDSLHLRGYLGIKAFGRSETWTRAAEGAATCSKAG